MKAIQFKAGGGDRGPILDVLVRRFELSRGKAKALLDTRNVFVNRRRVWMAKHPIAPGDVVEFMGAHAPCSQTSRPTAILHEDEDYLVADKPAGILSNGDGSLESQLRQTLSIPSLLAAHRLDRDTSGCLLLARRRESFDRIIPLFREKRVQKHYHAIVVGRLEMRDRTITIPIDGEDATTWIKVLRAGSEATHLTARIETGRTHQIRKHLEAIRHPLLGDNRYGTGIEATDKTLRVPRQMLHASDIAFTQPFTGRAIRVHAPLPADFRQCLRLFRLE